MYSAKLSIRRLSKFFLAACFLIAVVMGVTAEEKRFALVIGNGAYEHITKLMNPTNDARDMADELKDLGFTVDLLVDRDLSAMEDAVVRLGNRLSTSVDAVGFFYYAGHGVQSSGTNYLIPAEANIPSASFLQQKALALQSVLDTLQASGNKLNVVVLDACRDNPFSWSRSGTRGLTVVGAQPPGSIIVYATSAGSVAQDGRGRNGVFTGELLRHMHSPGTDIYDVFKQTGAAVSSDTAGSQIPAVYTQFFGSYALVAAAQPVEPAAEAAISTKRSYGSLEVNTVTKGTLYVDGKALTDISPGANSKFDSIEVGSRTVELRYADGKVEQQTLTVEAGSTARVAFTYRADLFKLVKAGTPQIVQAAISQGADVKGQDKYGDTPLIYAAWENPFPEVIATLLRAGADINARDDMGLTALMEAAMHNQNPEVIAALLKAGADAKAKDLFGKTALNYAQGNADLKGTDAFRKLEKASR
jgi:uncharacterized caspase-like protein